MMSWKEEFLEFENYFEKFDKGLQHDDLSEKDQEQLIADLNQTVSLGWSALQNFINSSSEAKEVFSEQAEMLSHDDKDDPLSKLFANQDKIVVEHKPEYWLQNEWEIREVIYPAFKDLRDTLGRLLE